MELPKVIYELETSLLSPEVRNSRERLDILLSDDFIEHGASGSVYDKNDILEHLPISEPFNYVISEFKTKQLSDDAVLATYRLKQINKQEERDSIRSSLWQNYGGAWKMIFHQGTLVKE